MLHHFWKQAEHWQTGVGAVLGFAGLYVASRLSFRRESVARRREVEAVAAAIYAELLLLREEAQKVANSIGGRYVHYQTSMAGEYLEKRFLEEREVIEPVIYRSLAPKIGLLPPHFVYAVVVFHRRYQQAHHWIPFLVADEQRGITYAVSYVLQPLVSGLRELDEVLGSLAVIANAGPPPALELGNADEALELEKDLYPLDD